MTVNEELEIAYKLIEKQREIIRKQEEQIANMKFSIEYLVAQLPKPVETPEEAGKRLARELLDELRNEVNDDK